MTIIEKYAHVSRYIDRRYKQEMNAWTDAFANSRFIAASTVIIRAEVFRELVMLLDRLDSGETF